MKNKEIKLLSCLIVAVVAATPAVSSAHSSALGSSGIFNHGGDSSSDSQDQTTDESKKTQQGKEIFSAVHFMVGEKAKNLTLVQDIRESPDFDEEANTRFATETMDALQEKDPEYFAKYAKEMTIGNPVSVERAITRGQEDIKQYVKTAYPENAEQGEMTPQACSIGVGGCVWTVALAWNYGAVINVGAAINVYAALWGPDKTWSPVSEENAPLQRQTMIATLAHELKTT